MPEKSAAEKVLEWSDKPSKRIVTSKKSAQVSKEKRRSYASLLLPVIAGVVLLFLWEMQFLHTIFHLQLYQLPIPSAILEALIDNLSLLLGYAGYTMTEAVVGMLIGSATGFVIALTATAWPKWGRGGLLLVASLNAVPIVALAPIMNLWFGSGIGSRIAIVTVITMAAMAINAHKGMRMVSPLALDLMHSYAAKKGDVFRYLRIMNSLPYVFLRTKNQYNGKYDWCYCRGVFLFFTRSWLFALQFN
ncbi:ABC transporter permease [Gracilibacillus salinarum]|uniref:ABC transporter permease n=1 Tax=Gracilibacillus salinarum TaxID=2932255 RepID=A0ABY4GJV6_9BACI|nr:ABC transporter permease [Gracilibacillus salinarum]UOQ84465.1 ABC transporter permease [Gracilibacillus salinarum]